jgi:lysozyme
MVTNCNPTGRAFLAKNEGGHYLKAYLCQAKVWTISVGCTFYEDGTRVKQGDTITQERSEQLFTNTLKYFEQQVLNMTRDDISENQFNVLVDFAYQYGHNALLNSTLLRLVNEDPDQPAIGPEFLKWNKVAATGDGIDNDGDGLVDEKGEKKVSEGVLKRAQRRAALYYL